MKARWTDLLDLAASGLVDREWYLSTYPDVAAAGRDAFLHYTTQGWLERRCPGPLFDTDWYLTTYPDVAAEGIDPALHYVTRGWREGRRPWSSFDPVTYVRQEGIGGIEVCPLVHLAAVARCRQRALLTQPA